MTLPARDTRAPARSDEDLAAAHAAGDPDAFDQLFARYQGRVLSYAHRMLARRELAEEVCAQTFVRVLEGRWQPTGRFRSYLFAVAHRACLEQLRRRRIATRYAPWLSRRAPDATPEDLALGSDAERQLDAAVRALPEAHREVLLLYYGQELASREVAEILGCSDQQVRSKLAYARRVLREQIEEER